MTNDKLFSAKQKNEELDQYTPSKGAVNKKIGKDTTLNQIVEPRGSGTPINWDDRKAEILWGQAANLAYNLVLSDKDVDIERKKIFIWLWQTRNDYQQILKELDK